MNQASQNDGARALPQVGSNDVTGRMERLEQRCAEASSECRSLSEEVAEAGAKLAVAAQEFAGGRGRRLSGAERRLMSAVADMVAVALGAAGVRFANATFASERAPSTDGELQREVAHDESGAADYCCRCGVQWGSYEDSDACNCSD